MIYINNELFKRTKTEDKESLKRFQSLFAKHLDETGRIIKPIVLKYAPHYIQKDIDNPGKLAMPRSLKLSFVTNTFYDGQMAEVRYSKSAGIPQQNGAGMKFLDNGTQVVAGSLSINDVDLAYYLWRFSSQIHTKPEYKDNPSAFFEIENLEGERREAVIRKAITSTANARLWNTLADGGVSDATIRLVAKNFMVPNVDAMDIDEIKLIIDKMIQMNPANMDIFLRLTDKNSAPKEVVSERRGVIADAIEGNIICQDSMKKSFFMIGADGNPEGKPIFTYKQGEKDPKGALYVYLEGSNPEFLEDLKTRLEIA
jgi:hypothetical protein